MSIVERISFLVLESRVVIDFKIVPEFLTQCSIISLKVLFSVLFSKEKTPSIKLRLSSSDIFSTNSVIVWSKKILVLVI